MVDVGLHFGLKTTEQSSRSCDSARPLRQHTFVIFLASGALRVSTYMFVTIFKQVQKKSVRTRALLPTIVLLPPVQRWIFKNASISRAL